MVCRHFKGKQPDRTKRRASSRRGAYGVEFTCDVSVAEGLGPQSQTDTCVLFEKANTQQASSSKKQPLVHSKFKSTLCLISNGPGSYVHLVYRWTCVY